MCWIEWYTEKHLEGKTCLITVHISCELVEGVSQLVLSCTDLDGKEVYALPRRFDISMMTVGCLRVFLSERELGGDGVERRLGRDGVFYSEKEFAEWYGDKHKTMWAWAPVLERSYHCEFVLPSSRLLSDVPRDQSLLSLIDEESRLIL